MLTEIELQVLLAIGRGAAHGYAIGKDIAERSDGRLDPATGALYHALRRLTRDGLIRNVRVPAGEAEDPRRKYFELTRTGRDAVSQEVKRLEELVKTARARRLYPRGA